MQKQVSALPTRRAALAALASVPALAVPTIAIAAPVDLDGDLRDLLARHLEAYRESNKASCALADLEEMLGEDGTRSARALKWICAPRDGQGEGERVYLHSHVEIDKWCDNPKGISFTLLEKETPEQIRARLHAEFDADKAVQDAKCEANGLCAAERRVSAANTAEAALEAMVLSVRPLTLAGAVALLTHAVAIDDPGLYQNPLSIVARNILASGAFAANA